MFTLYRFALVRTRMNYWADVRTGEVQQAVESSSGEIPYNGYISYFRVFRWLSISLVPTPLISMYRKHLYPWIFNIAACMHLMVPKIYTLEIYPLIGTFTLVLCAFMHGSSKLLNIRSTRQALDVYCIRNVDHAHLYTVLCSHYSYYFTWYYYIWCYYWK